MAFPVPKTTTFRTLLTYATLAKTLVTETALQACDQIAANVISADPFPTGVSQWIASNHTPLLR